MTVCFPCKVRIGPLLGYMVMTWSEVRLSPNVATAHIRLIAGWLLALCDPVLLGRAKVYLVLTKLITSSTVIKLRVYLPRIFP